MNRSDGGDEQFDIEAGEGGDDALGAGGESPGGGEVDIGEGGEELDEDAGFAGRGAGAGGGDGVPGFVEDFEAGPEDRESEPVGGDEPVGERVA